MSEVSVFIRQGNVNRASIKSQKRPLSIITENDTDDIDVIDYTKYQDTDCCGKENTFSTNTLESNRTLKASDITSNVSETAWTPNCQTFGLENKTSSKLQSVASKHQLCGIQTIAPVWKYIISKSEPNLPESNISFPDVETTDRSNIIPVDAENKSPYESCSKQEAESPNFSDVIITEIQHSNKITSHSQSLEAIQNEAAVNQINNLNSSKSCIDVQSLERIPDPAERLQFPSQCSPTSSSPSSTVTNNIFRQRLWTQTSTPRNVHDIKSPLGQSYQQLTSSIGTPHLVSLALASSPDADDTTNNISYQFPSDFTDNYFSQSQANQPSLLSKSTLKQSKLSSYFSRRMSNESTGSMSESDLSDGEIGLEDSQPTYLSYFRRLKETTDRLSLSARRPSIMLWRQQYMESQSFPRTRSNQNGDVCDDSLTSDRKLRIDKALEWLRLQLQEMRLQDQNLARQLLAIRHDIHKLKLQRSTEEHQELIDDFHFELQEIQEFSEFLDLPVPEYGDNPLKHIGVTRLNISARRFSAC